MKKINLQQLNEIERLLLYVRLQRPLNKKLIDPTKVRGIKRLRKAILLGKEVNYDLKELCKFFRSVVNNEPTGLAQMQDGMRGEEIVGEHVGSEGKN